MGDNNSCVSVVLPAILLTGGAKAAAKISSSLDSAHRLRERAEPAGHAELVEPTGVIYISVTLRRYKEMPILYNVSCMQASQ